MAPIAFFDLDYTLIGTSSSRIYIKEAVKQDRLSPLYAVTIGLLYQLNLIEFGQAHARLITRVAKDGQVEAAKFFAQWIPRTLYPHLLTQAQEKVEWHRNQGHRVMIVSASIGEIVKPVAAHLGLGEDYLCTHLAIENGRYTGELDGPACHGTGKVYWVKQWAAKNKLTFPLNDSYFYSDSATDLPLLERVTYPIVVNPSGKLAKIAEARGWPIERFHKD
jgi:HAD superfamily hydrolase (TIGR01490 family)